MKSSVLRHKERTSIIIPTYDNVEQLMDCVGSILRTDSAQPVQVIVVNNGEAPLSELQGIENVLVIKAKENLGWEGGLKEGLKHSTSKYVVFMNDDTYLPRGEMYWLRNMLRDMEIYPKIGAIGPSTNVAMGQQNIWAGPFSQEVEVRFLIGYCMVVRRSALDEVGGIDDTAPGGDDIDLSIRLRNAGYMLVVKKTIFVYHHGFQTGSRVYGDHTKTGGWNSPQMTEATNKWLQQKHGFLSWWETIVAPQVGVSKSEANTGIDDAESAAVKNFLISGSVLELGCGAKKTVPEAIGVDIVPKGEKIDFMTGPSVADYVADVQIELPNIDKVDNIIARHILEHCINPLKTIRMWSKALVDGGRMVITVPDERIQDSIPVNPEHVHAFTPESLDTIAEAAGLKRIGSADFYNNVSFTSCYERSISQ